MTESIDNDPILRRWQTLAFWRLATEAKGRCAYCDLDGSADPRILAQFEIDHLVPRTFGGTGHWSNLVFACGRCNKDKGKFNPSEGLAPAELTSEQRKKMISQAREFVENNHGRYYSELHKAIIRGANVERFAGFFACREG